MNSWTGIGLADVLGTTEDRVQWRDVAEYGVANCRTEIDQRQDSSVVTDQFDGFLRWLNAHRRVPDTRWQHSQVLGVLVDTSNNVFTRLGSVRHLTEHLHATHYHYNTAQYKKTFLALSSIKHSRL